MISKINIKLIKFHQIKIKTHSIVTFSFKHRDYRKKILIFNLIIKLKKDCY